MKSFLTILFFYVALSAPVFAQSLFVGKWSGKIIYKDYDDISATATFIVEEGRVVGFFKAWNDDLLTCTGYIDAETGKLIITTDYDFGDRHDRLEFKLDETGNKMIGGSYEYADKKSDIVLVREN